MQGTRSRSRMNSVSGWCVKAHKREEAHRTELQCKEKWCTRALELSSGHSKYSQHAMYEAERDNSQSQGRTEIKFCRGSASLKKMHKKCGGCPSASASLHLNLENERNRGAGCTT